MPAMYTRLPPAETRMKLRLLALALGCTGVALAWANAGLTSAGVNQPENNPQDEPTLAQVAPIQNAAGNGQAATPGGVPGTNSSGAGQPGGGAGSGASSAEAVNRAPAATPAPAPPPPPPDPSKLPVSVIRPVNKAPSEPLAETATPAPVQSMPPPHRAETRSAAPHGSEASAPPAVPTPAPPLRRAGTAPARTEDAPRPIAEPTATEGAADTGSSGFIFYTGIGTAAAILLLSLAAFFRGGSEEGTKSRPL
jgi:hypothetical protein